MPGLDFSSIGPGFCTIEYKHRATIFGEFHGTPLNNQPSEYPSTLHSHKSLQNKSSPQISKVLNVLSSIVKNTSLKCTFMLDKDTFELIKCPKVLLCHRLDPGQGPDLFDHPRKMCLFPASGGLFFTLLNREGL